MNFKVLVPFLLASLAAVAGGEHGAHHEEGVPRVVLYEAINVLIIFSVGYWLARHKISSFFAEKRKKYIEDQDRAKRVLVTAQNEHHEVKTRLEKLKNNRLETLSKARADAMDLKNQILADADILAKRLQLEAELAAKIEMQRAKNELRELLLIKALELSKKDIHTKTTAEDQKRLQKEFIAKVEVVQ